MLAKSHNNRKLDKLIQETKGKFKRNNTIEERLVQTIQQDRSYIKSVIRSNTAPIQSQVIPDCRIDKATSVQSIQEVKANERLDKLEQRMESLKPIFGN